MNSFVIKNVGDKAITIYLGNKISSDINLKVHYICEKINQDSPPWLIDVVPAYNSLTVIYDLFKINSEKVKHYLLEIVPSKNPTTENSVNRKPIINIPVKYGGEEGPDLEYVADYCKLPSEEVVNIHSSNVYLVYMIGFSPGFPYLGKLDSRIRCPRLEKPRMKVSPGSVGLADDQTGIYSIESPGGWRLIGKTPISLFNLEKSNPFFILPGTKVKFFSIDLRIYDKIQRKILKGENILDFEEDFD